MKSILSYLFFGLVGIAFGIFMIAQPETIINIAAFVFSAALAIRGLRTLFDTIRFSSRTKNILVNGVPVDATLKDNVKRTMFLNALLSAIIGVAALIIAIVFLSSRNSGIMVGVVYVIAAGFLATGIIGFVENRLMKVNEELFDMFSEKSFLYIVVGVLLLMFPLLIGHTVINIIGVIVIVSSLGSVIGAIIAMVKHFKNKKEEKDSEVSYTEVK